MTVKSRLDRIEGRMTPPTEPPQGPVWLQEIKKLLHLFTVDELRALKDSARLAGERGYPDDRMIDDADFAALVAELQSRANARQSLPRVIIDHILHHHSIQNPCLDQEVDFVRQSQAYELTIHGLDSVDLRQLAVGDMAVLLSMRTNGPGAVTSGFTLKNVDRVEAEAVVNKILVDGRPLRLSELPGLAEELAGAPLSQNELHQRLMRKLGSSRKPSDRTQNTAEQNNSGSLPGRFGDTPGLG